MSSRADFVPRQYVDLFCSLQDAVPPRPGEHVRRAIASSLRDRNDGLEFDDVFESFDDDAIGSASIGQVHRAVLREELADVGGYNGGRDVAVKVMHPDAQSRFANDFKVFGWLCRIALPGWEPILTELEGQMMTEFDYANEAASLRIVGENMSRSPYAGRVKVPEPAEALCSRNVLVMEMLEGRKLADAIVERLAAVLGGDAGLAREVLKAKERDLFLGSDGKAEKVGRGDFYREVRGIVGGDIGVLRQLTVAVKLMLMTRKMTSTLDLLLDVHGHQIFHDGCFNGDPHPGECCPIFINCVE